MNSWQQSIRQKHLMFALLLLCRSGHLHVSEIMRTGYARKGTWDSKENQVSAMVELEADSLVLLHAARYEVRLILFDGCYS